MRHNDSGARGAGSGRTVKGTRSVAAPMPPRVGPRLFRTMINLWPAIRGTGQRVVFVADDWSEVRVVLPLNWRTRNYVGTIFGGSMYGACDPHFMLLLIHRLGDEFVVWDKSASIRFRRPGRTKLYATFRVPDEEVAAIKEALRHGPKVDRTYSVDLVDADGVVHATVEKVVHVRRKHPAPSD